MKKDKHIIRPPQESLLKDEGLSHLFAQLPSIEPSSTDLKWSVMSRIREIDNRRKKREKVIFYLCISLVIVLGIAASVFVIHYLFSDASEEMRAAYSGMAETLGNPMIYIVLCTIFFYLSIDLWVSHRCKSRKSKKGYDS
ncbi:hypothetical protein [Porphyromonas sp.]|uniref:hypothetical protein n=1 Tax=Porphyromonas sp. TaxID=1924944 RepID=UPI0026DD118B|nr:hypothetical protein [Porphyromonas sp.]MDO4770577.1 hypothetical protein [Porphyromonas sp.]